MGKGSEGGSVPRFRFRNPLSSISSVILTNLKWSFLVNGWWVLPEDYVSTTTKVALVSLIAFGTFLYVLSNNVFLSVFSSLILFAVMLSLVLAYPIVKALSTIKKAEAEFIYFLMTLYTASTASKDVIEVMKVVAESSKNMGKLLKIAIRDAEGLGIPFNRALSELAKEIPSPKISTFLQSLAEAIENRGDISDFVKHTFNLSLSDLESKLVKASQTAGTLVEIYINAVLLMPLIVITMGLALAPLSGGVFLGLSLRDLSLLVIFIAVIASAILTLISGGEWM